MRRYFGGIWGIMRAYQLRFFRDKVGMFFTFLFPMIFLLIFGTISSGNNMSFNVAIINHSDSEFAKGFIEGAASDEMFKIDDSITNLDDAKEQMSRGELDSAIVLPESFGQPADDQMPTGQLQVYYSPNAEQAGSTVGAIMEQILDGINREMGQPDPRFSVERVSTGKEGMSSFDYTFSGLLGFTILGASIFGLANVMPAEKQRGSFRRLRAAPFRSSQLIIGNALHYLTLSLLSLLLMIIIGSAVFDFTMRGSWLQFGVFATLSSIMMIGFGLIIGGWARNENQAAPLTNLVAFPLMFLSGIFFPRFLFPEWLQGITGFVPLSPVIDGMRRIMTENANLLELGPELAMIGAWAVVLYAVTAKVFRWE